MNLEQVELQPSLRSKLVAQGYETVEELKNANLIELSKELKLSREEVNRVFELTRGGVPVLPTKTIMDILSEDKGITLSSSNLNSLFDDGIPPLRLTEICGESGSGKTQLCMQLAVNVQLPKDKGGMNGECIYIDTEGSFLPSRLYKMKNSDHTEDILLFLNKIHLFRVFNHAELISLIRQLPDILTNAYKNVKLIVIDSMAYHFRFNCMTTQRRNLILPYLAQSLIRIATNHKLAVVVSNHVTENGPDGAWIPALGSSWGHWCAFRLFLFRKRHFRFGYLYKNIEEEDIKPVQFCIKENGITDPDREEAIQSQQLANEEITEKLENSWGGIKIEKTDDIWNDNLLVNDKNVLLDGLPPSESESSNHNNEPESSSQNDTTPTTTTATTTTTNTINTTPINNNNRITINEVASPPILVNNNHNSSNRSSITQNGSSSPASSSSKTLTTDIDNNHKSSSDHRMELAESSKATKTQAQPTELNQIEEIPQGRRGRKRKTSAMTEVNAEEKPTLNNVRSSRSKGKGKAVTVAVVVNQVEEEEDVQMSMDEPLAETADQPTSRGKAKKRKVGKDKEKIQDGDLSLPLNKEEMISEQPKVSPPPSKPRGGRKRKAVEQPKTKDRKKRGARDQEMSDWSESEIEDDFNFIYHFEDPF